MYVYHNPADNECDHTTHELQDFTELKVDVTLPDMIEIGLTVKG